MVKHLWLTTNTVTAVSSNIYWAPILHTAANCPLPVVRHMSSSSPSSSMAPVSRGIDEGTGLIRKKTCWVPMDDWSKCATFSSDTEVYFFEFAYLRNKSVVSMKRVGAITWADTGDCVMIGQQIRSLPSFMIIGAMKSGTGALLRWLGMHGNIWSESRLHEECLKDDSNLITSSKRQRQRSLWFCNPTSSAYSGESDVLSFPLCIHHL